MKVTLSLISIDLLPDILAIFSLIPLMQKTEKSFYLTIMPFKIFKITIVSLFQDEYLFSLPFQNIFLASDKTC